MSLLSECCRAFAGVTTLLAGIGLVLAQTGAEPADATSSSSVASTNSGPRIQFAETTYDFGRVEAGTVVRHDFAFTNAGSQTLEIKNVASSCGCTTLGEPTRRVEPGKFGILPVQFDSGGMSGPIMKNLTLACNDPVQSDVVLYFKATVWKPIDALPGIASFFFGPDIQTNQTRVIRLVSNLEQPVALSEPALTNKAFRAELRTVKEGKEFELKVTVVPPLPGGTTTTPITMRSTSAKMALVTVNAYAVVQPAVTVSPSPLVLDPGPSDGARRYSISIESRSTNILVLSEPMLDVQGAALKLTEVKPGRQFTLDVTLPPGLKLPTGKTAAVTIKCNHPQSPTLRVPIFQMADPDTDSGGDAGKPARAEEKPSATTEPSTSRTLATEK